jgi:hypothetical protein
MKPVCGKCTRLKRVCIWSEDVQILASTRRQQYAIVTATNKVMNNFSGQDFMLEFPGVDSSTLPYIHHFVTFCCRFLVYPNDSEGNPFEEQLVPLAIASPALLHSMAAVAAGHLTRGQEHHGNSAARHYSLALKEMTTTLSNPDVARSDATLGACLLLCVYEVMSSTSSGDSILTNLPRYAIHGTAYGFNIYKVLEI